MSNKAREFFDADIRLVLLQVLARQQDNRLSDRMLVKHLENDGHRLTVETVRPYLAELERLRAVTLPVDRPDLIVAEITTLGLGHVGRRSRIPGVRWPDPGEGEGE